VAARHAGDVMTEQWRTEITAFEKSDGPLTKRI
jgi:hypothetical protein